MLVIACINFMNLSTASSAERAREVGIRKSIGALRSQLSVQFLSETVLLALLALVLAILLLWPGVLYVDALSLTVSILGVRAALANPVEALRSE